MRYNLIDTLRGFSVLSMIAYHTCWDIVYIYGGDLPWFYSSTAYIWQQSICWTFILISGFCQYLASHSLKDGLVVFAAGVVITVASLILPAGVEIYYGILTFLGLAFLITALFKKFLYRIPPVPGFLVFLGLFILTRGVNSGYLGFEDYVLYRLPDVLYLNDFSGLGLFTTLIGFPARNFLSGDYFSLIPWYFLFMTGFYIAGIMKKSDSLKILETPKIPILNFLGRHALIIYMIHQPLIYVILSLIKTGKVYLAVNDFCNKIL